MRADIANANTNDNTDADTYTNCNAYSECNADSHTNTYSTVRNAYANTTQSDTKASADSASSSVILRKVDG